MPSIAPITLSLSKGDTIIALCTPQGSGALALIRLSGVHAWDIGGKVIKLATRKELASVESHTVHAAHIYHGDKLVDSVMVMALRGPRTFTGYDTIEITCHNNPFIIQEIIALCVQHGARPAQPGEFTRQAYENKKIDLLQAEAIHDLIGAQTQAALTKSLAQLTGSLSNTVHVIEDTLSKALAWCESSFEFLDDEGDFYKEINQFLQDISAHIEPLVTSYHAQKQIRQGYRVAIIGSVNAGKSSLFNMLVGHKRAIVTPLAGTTRDSIENTIIINDTTVTLIDTAGLRNTNDIIEQEGIERTRHEAHASDCLLLVIDGSAMLSHHEQETYRDLIAQYGNKTILVKNKADLSAETHTVFDDAQPIIISAHSTTAKQILEHAILAKLRQLYKQHELPYLINQRHYDILCATYNDIQQIRTMLSQAGTSPHYELISYHLRQALEHLSGLTGKAVSEIALDRVFKEFCVGK